MICLERIFFKRLHNFPNFFRARGKQGKDVKHKQVTQNTSYKKENCKLQSAAIMSKAIAKHLNGK